MTATRRGEHRRLRGQTRPSLTSLQLMSLLAQESLENDVVFCLVADLGDNFGTIVKNYMNFDILRNNFVQLTKKVNHSEIT